VDKLGNNQPKRGQLDQNVPYGTLAIYLILLCIYAILNIKSDNYNPMVIAITTP